MKFLKPLCLLLFLLPLAAKSQTAPTVKAAWQIDSVNPKPGQKLLFHKEALPSAADFRNYMLDLAFYYHDVKFAFHVDSAYRGYTFNSDWGQLFQHFLDSQPYPGQFTVLPDSVLGSDSFYVVVTHKNIKHQGIDSAKLRSGQWDFFSKQQLTDSNWVMKINQMLLDTNITLELMVFTDCRNTAEYNKDYSQKVADGLRQMMYEAGLDASRVDAKGMGETIIFNKRCRCEGVTEFTKAKLCTEEQHQMNRKTIIKLRIKNAGPVYSEY